MPRRVDRRHLTMQASSLWHKPDSLWRRYTRYRHVPDHTHATARQPSVDACTASTSEIPWLAAPRCDRKNNKHNISYIKNLSV